MTSPRRAPEQHRPKGARTRDSILARATEVASVHGLDGLSIGSLASDMRMSKSGLFAHFGSKEELQLATIAAAREVFMGDVVEAARSRARGLSRLVALCDGYLRYSEQRVFPAGCFFFGATTELSGRAGVVHEEAAGQMRAWLGLLAENVAAAIEEEELDVAVDARLLSFQLISFLTTANWLATAVEVDRSYADARAAIAAALASAGASRGALAGLLE